MKCDLLIIIDMDRDFNHNYLLLFDLFLYRSRSQRVLKVYLNLDINIPSLKDIAYCNYFYHNHQLISIVDPPLYSGNCQ